ncbi:MAG TPA: gamma-butyrobetaine hydroxylase-like domain-containing protein [Acidobacteriota bacterium]|nr:gamma-butyrobetaine hydroxylase-like domain-containing protein [Acidobacteriota bacterium]
MNREQRTANCFMEVTLPYLMPTIVKRVTPVQTDVTWNDGHFSSYPSWYLRENCPCAGCVDEFTGRRRLDAGSIPSTLERVSIEVVGNYALQFTWSDGHSTGIYTFDHLRRICPCPQCLPEGLKEPPKTVLKPGSFEV